jgi:hypothetical protein
MAVARVSNHEAGFSLAEVLMVMCCATILAGIGLPVLGTMTDSYGLALTAQEITVELQYARMKAVTSNEPIRVHFLSTPPSCQIEADDGSLISGPYGFPPGIVLNTSDTGSAITFPGSYVTFLPAGSIPPAGDGSAGRVKIINRSGVRIDIVVSTGGMIRATPAFRISSPPF